MTDKEYFNQLWDRSKGRLLIAALLLCLIISIVFNVHQCNRPRYEPVSTDTTTTVDVKSHVDSMPQELMPEKVVNHVTVPFLSNSAHSGKDSHVKELADSLLDDSIMLKDGEMLNTFPIVQKVYGDSTYTAYVSGPKVDSIGPRLDSIQVREVLVTRNITNTIVQKKHWHFGIGAGAGIGVTSRTPDIFVGFIAMYEF